MYSCRKTDMKVATQVDDSAIVEAFLHLPNDADPLLIRVTQELRKKDAAQPFIKRLMVHAGMPRWDYSELKLPSGSQPYGRIVINTTGSQQKVLSEQNANDTTVLIPFVHEGVKRVNSFLAVHLADSMRIGLFQGKDFASFRYTENGEKPTAKAVAMRCMLFDHKIFKHNTFRVIDKQLALSLSGGRDTSGLFTYKKDDIATNLLKVKPNLAIAVTTCEGGSWVCDPTTYWNTYTQDHCPLVYIGGNCSTQWFYFQDPVNQIPDFGSGPALSTGGGGGVASTSALYAEADRVPEAWEASDENGFYYARRDALAALLDEEAFHIIPCDQLNIMPLDDNGANGYGLMFKRVAQKEVSSTIRARLDSIAAVAPTSILNPIKVQSISNAYGPVVNCDYFAVHISALPSNVSAENLVEFFRKYTSNFIDPTLSVSFSPYTDGGFTDATKFYSPFEQSLGTLVHINMLNDGTVVESEYYRSSSPFKCRFTYSTISSPLDYNHPVSGNREFGIFENPGNNGYTFYTMGVDRTTDWTFGLFNSFSWGFESADALWSNVQQKMVQYVNNNGGQAISFTPVTARPKWNHVQRYLRGEISFTLLKKLSGC